MHSSLAGLPEHAQEIYQEVSTAPGMNMGGMRNAPTGWLGERLRRITRSQMIHANGELKTEKILDKKQDKKPEQNKGAMSWTLRSTGGLSKLKQTRVLLADDHARIRAGIRQLLSDLPDILVIGEASDGEEALKMVEELTPDVLLLDVEMPRKNGQQVAMELRDRQSKVRVLVFSAYDDRNYIEGMFNSGVSGYLTKDEVPEVLIEALRGVARGEDGWVSKRVERIIGE